MLVIEKYTVLPRKLQNQGIIQVTRNISQMKMVTDIRQFSQKKKTSVAKDNNHMLLILRQEYKIISVVRRKIKGKKKSQHAFFSVPLSVTLLEHYLILGVFFSHWSQMPFSIISPQHSRKLRGFCLDPAPFNISYKFFLWFSILHWSKQACGHELGQRGK